MNAASGSQGSVAAQAAPRVCLSVNSIEVIYDHVILVLKGVSLDVPEGGIVALLGANGAGKTTTLKAISNLLRAERGEVTKGTIEYRGERIDRLTPNDLVRRGVCQVMEGRHCFAHLTVEENLLTGAFTRKGSRGDISTALDKVYHYFPRLKQRRTQNTLVALRHAGYGYILENGRVVMDGVASELAKNEDVKEFYLGLSTAGRKSFRDVKHYRRRKRWLA
jgi:branched-chain amino acid transport system ATP-binding protein